MSPHEIPPDLRDSDLEPAALRRQLDGIWRTPRGILGALCTVDHKIIGRRYIATAFVFLALGGVLAMLIRLQLSRPEGGDHGPRPLQPDLHHARREHDVPVRRAGDGGGRGLSSCR